MENKSSFIKKLLIAFALIFLILFFISQKHAGALVRKSEQLWNPDLTKTYSTSLTTSGNQKWAPFTFSSNWTNNTNYDLIGFKFNKLTYTIMYNYSNIIIDGEMTTGQPGYTNQIDLQITNTQIYSLYGESLTFTGILFDKDGNGTQCWRSAEFADTFLCPLIPNTTYKSFEVIINYQVPNDYTLSLSMVLERTRFFYNYDSTEIINSNGEIVQQQQETNQTITNSDTTGAGTGAVTDFSNGSTSLNTELNNAVGVNSFKTIFTNFFTQIENSTCTPLSLPIPYTNENLVLPCLGTEFQNRIPVLWTLYVTIITGVIVLKFWRHYIDMFKHLLDPYSTGLHDVGDIAGGGK